jgi:dTDP-4-amino-4,6-dideoxygalactose transaminase
MISVCELLTRERELEYVAECIKSSWMSSKGKYIEEFEERFAHCCGRKHGITTTGGTTALHLALVSLGIGKEDEVIVPTLTMSASLFPIVYTGAGQVLVDSEPETWNMDVTKVEEKITRRTKATMPVHLYGHRCDMNPVVEIAKRYNLYVVEDAAEVHGAEYKGRKAGSIGDMGCFSFYFAKNLGAYGESGMITTSNPDIAEQCRALRDQLRAYLETKGVATTGMHYPIPIHRQEAWPACGGTRVFLPVTEMVTEQILSLPMYPELTEPEVGYICDCIQEFMQSRAEVKGGVAGQKKI